MTMSSRTRISLVSLLLLVVIAVVALVVNQRGVGEFAGEKPAIRQEQDIPEPQSDEKGSEKVAQESSGVTMAPARQIDHDPGEPSTSSTPQKESNERPIDLAFQSATKLAIEKALSGDQTSAIEVSRLVMKCRRHRIELESIMQMIERTREQSHFPIRIAEGFYDEGRRTYHNIREYAEALLRIYDECEATNHFFVSDLRERVQTLAESGLPTARYLYAMWPPTEFEANPVEMVERLEYERKALEYTWRNIDEKEPLGLLAIAQSSLRMNTKLFTPGGRPSYGHLLIVASMECGLEGAWMDELLLGAFDGRSSAEPDEIMKYLLIHGSELAGMLCL